jgi:hypothetical protein
VIIGISSRLLWLKVGTAKSPSALILKNGDDARGRFARAGSSSLKTTRQAFPAPETRVAPYLVSAVVGGL